MKIREWINELKQYSNADINLIRLDDNILRVIREESDMCGLSMVGYIKEALHNYRATKYMLSQFEKIADMKTDNAIREVAKQEAITFIKEFKNKGVDITIEELTNLIQAKILHDGL
jgi:hypothetical protein